MLRHRPPLWKPLRRPPGHPHGEACQCRHRRRCRSSTNSTTPRCHIADHRPPAVGTPPRRASPGAGKGPPAGRHGRVAAGRRCPRRGEPQRAIAAAHAAIAVIHETRSRSGGGRVGEGTHSRVEKASPLLSSRPHGLPLARSSNGEVRRKWRRGRRGAVAGSVRAGYAGAEKRPCPKNHI